MTEKERQEVLCKLQVYDAIYRNDGAFHLSGAEMEVYQTCARNEEILTFDKARLLSILAINLNKEPLYDFQLDAMCSYAKPLIEKRPYLEFFHHNRIQATVAACIHDSVSDKIILLKIAKPNGIISDYTEGTLTFPQGHVAITNDTYKIAIKNGNLRHVLNENINREIYEELDNADGYERTGVWGIEAISSLARSAPIYPIYVDKVGSSEKHICFLYDIDMVSHHNDWFNTHPEASIEESINDPTIISNEPTKHSVCVSKIFDIHKIATSNICPWVLRALGIISI